MGEKEWEPSTLFDVSGDSLARRILVMASDRPVSAAALADELDVSQPTVYRRVNALLEYDLVRADRQIDGDGNHYKAYETTLKEITFEVEAGGYTVDLELRQSLAGQFESFWSDLEDARLAGTTDAGGQPEPSIPDAGPPMAEPPEFWTFAAANLLVFGFGATLTGLSYFAYRVKNRHPSFRLSTVGFGVLTVGGVIEPIYQLGLKGDYHLSGRELLALQTIERLLIGLGLALLFFSIYTYNGRPNPTSVDTLEQSAGSW